VNSFVKETPHQTFTETSPPRTKGISAGASWAWNSGNADVSYWNYSLDSSVDGQSYNSAGRGAYASIGAYADAIGFYAGLMYHYAEDFAAFSNTVDRGYDAYLSVYYKPRYLPDIVVDGSFGREEYNSFNYTSDATYWSATLGFDFSKYLWSPVETKSKVSSKLPMAKLFYGYYSQSIVGAAPTGSHLVGMMFRTGLY
jgi:hypothetical protein